MDNKFSNIKERILYLTDLYSVSKEKFFSEIGMSYASFKGSAKERPLNSDAIENLLTKYPNLNARWLLTGEGNASGISKSYNVQEPSETYKLKTDHTLANQSVPLYNIEAAASLITLFKDHSSTDQIGTISIPNIPKCDGALHITGDSMYPLLKSGDIVMFKNIPDPMVATIFYGEMYLISFMLNDDEYITVKWIQRSESSDQLKLVSENRHHEPVDIPRSCIRAIALVKASVRVNAMR